jgi:hypothetical protein
MMPRRPKKLSDTLKKSQPLFGRPTNSFAEAYPSIESMTFNVSERNLYGQEVDSWTFDTASFRAVIDCSNDECTGGGVDTALILKRMMWDKKTELETVHPCRGREKARQRTCDRSYEIKASVKYKEPKP